jgi:hypothetical protein
MSVRKETTVIKMVRWSPASVAVILALVSVLHAVPAAAQSRLSDKDLERLMENLKQDAQPFKQTFASALKKSTIRKTSREKDARELADSFAKQTDSALQTFKHNRKAEDQVSQLVNTAGQIDSLVYSLHLNPQTTGQWEKLRTELHQVAQAFGVPEPYFQSPGTGAAGATAMNSGGANGTTCLAAVGAERAQRLVSECTQVSPSTHPPCNAQNACPLIIDEIKRGCALIGQNAPTFCAEYR